MGTKTPMVAGKPVCEKPGTFTSLGFFVCTSVINEGNVGKQFIQVKPYLTNGKINTIGAN